MRSLSPPEPYKSQYLSTMQKVSNKSPEQQSRMIVTSQNEVLSKSKKKIYGKIAKVGIGFGTGRHTAHVHDHGTNARGKHAHPLKEPDTFMPKINPPRFPFVNRNIASKSCEESERPKAIDIALSARPTTPRAQIGSVGLSARTESPKPTAKSKS